MRTFPARLMVFGGLFVILLGFVYGSIFAGIPYQDPTPELSASYNLHLRVSEIIVVVGIGVLLLGMAGGVAKFIFKKFGKVPGAEK